MSDGKRDAPPAFIGSAVSDPQPPPHDDAAQHRHDAMRDAEPPGSEPRAEVIARVDTALRGQLTAEHRAMCELELVRVLAMDDVATQRRAA